MKNKTRVAAIIETPHGVLLVQDLKDKHKDVAITEIRGITQKAVEQREHAVAIVQDGRYSLPGGKIDPGETPEQAVLRELEEELAVNAEIQDMTKVLEIIGQTRDHLIFVVKVRGIIKLAPNEISGIGLLKRKNTVPLTHNFFQTHVRELHHRYMSSPERESLRPGFMSDLQISENLVDNWLADEQHGYLFRSSKSRRSSKVAHPPQRTISLPNFQIYDRSLAPFSPEIDVSLTRSTQAKIIPAPAGYMPQPRKKSDPHMKAVTAAELIIAASSIKIKNK